MNEQPQRRNAFGLLAEAGAPLIVIAKDALPVRKMSIVVPMTPELLAEQQEMAESNALILRLLNGTATPEERAIAEARRAAWKADSEARHAAAVAEWQQVRERYAGSPAILAVLDIHQPADDGSLDCAHPYFGYESDPEDWPCSTYEAIRDAP